MNTGLKSNAYGCINRLTVIGQKETSVNSVVFFLLDHWASYRVGYWVTHHMNWMNMVKLIYIWVKVSDEKLLWCTLPENRSPKLEFMSQVSLLIPTQPALLFQISPILREERVKKQQVDELLRQELGMGSWSHKWSRLEGGGRSSVSLSGTGGRLIGHRCCILGWQLARV